MQVLFLIEIFHFVFFSVVLILNEVEGKKHINEFNLFLDRISLHGNGYVLSLAHGNDLKKGRCKYINEDDPIFRMLSLKHAPIKAAKMELELNQWQITLQKTTKKDTN